MSRTKISSFFKILSEGYIKHCSKLHILLDEYYTDAKSERQVYDLVIPKNTSGTPGLVLCIHGGGWFEGNKGPYIKPMIQACEDRGYAYACLNYRYINDKISFEDILDDITSALSAIKAEGKKRGVNFEKVLLNGISAGGHLSLLYAYTRKDSAPVKPVCVVEICGPTDLEHEFYYSEENSISKAVGAEFFRNVIGNGAGCKISLDDFDAARPNLKKASPINFVNENTVPTFFGHGEQDEIVPYQNAVDLDAKLTEFGVEHTFVSFPNSGHGCEDKASMSKIMQIFFDCADKYLK